MQGGDDKQKFIWMGLIVLAFIAGAVVSMAGMRAVRIPAGGQSSPQAHAAAAGTSTAGH
ncbi:MAG TPA: hypothetical protein V6D22_23665 [Candidatus Obscuribacterales bacterium]